jgi:hypothetical protein
VPRKVFPPSTFTETDGKRLIPSKEPVPSSKLGNFNFKGQLRSILLKSRFFDEKIIKNFCIKLFIYYSYIQSIHVEYGSGFFEI